MVERMVVRKAEYLVERMVLSLAELLDYSKVASKVQMTVGLKALHSVVLLVEYLVELSVH